MPGSFKTEAVVLRSIRYGEADRIVHLYSATRGKIGAIAKGSRRPKSRFGGRLEPFFRLNLVLYEGRGELATVTGASTVEGHARLRGDGAALQAAGRGCDTLLRMFDTGDPNPAAYNLLCNYLGLLDEDPGAASDAGTALAFRLKLALAAGFAPELGSCARCGEGDHLTAFSGAAGGVVCASCEGDGFPLAAESHGFMVESLSLPLAQSPGARRGTAAQVDRAITETLEHHAHVRLRAAA
ncbi:MAG: DNA repair protein RecO [Solirubrobacterales bacterium]